MYNISMHTPIAIIGAGPAGMTAALFAAQNGAQVTLLDSNPAPGRKLLVTGSGRANLTNQNVRASAYSCGDPAWMGTLLSKFGHDELIHFFESLGVLTYATSDGWTYPVSDSAQSVVNAFKTALERSGVNLLLDHRITAIRKFQKGFSLKIDNHEDLTCDKLIVAAGGKAYPTLGSKGELFPSLKTMGHTVLPLVPALGPVTCDMRSYQPLQGIRLDAHVTLFEKASTIGETTGNLIFTQWGLNGPAVMDLSHLVASRPSANLRMSLNFLSNDETGVREMIQQHRRESIPLMVMPGSSLPPKLTAFLIGKAGLKPEATLDKTSDAQIEKLFDLITRLQFQVTGVRDFEYCQVSAGGVPVKEVDPNTMQSRIVTGLYLVGETLDVVGPCGGYNLQYAFSSGAVAGMAVI
jgi:predicted Rossmann fold flavoprotein